MADAVAETFEHGGALVCEAGTGVGKSLAYLIPAASAGRTVVISTATRALQSQLLHDDLPLAEAALGRSIDAVVLKGRGNYVCRLAAADVEQRLVDLDHPAALERLRPWLSSTVTGDRAELDFAPPAGLWGELSVGPERCRGARCALQSTCFSERARARAGEAEIVFVNHALYFADLGLRLASDGRIGVLPEHDVVVFDEAHELEDVAAEWLGARIGASDLVRLSREIERACERDGTTRPSADLVDMERHGAALAAALGYPESRRRLRPPDVAALPVGATSGLRDALSTLAARLEGAGDECDLVARQTLRLASALERCLDADPDETVVWSERGETGARLCAAPVMVGQVLRDALWDRIGSAVLCSATLATGDDLGFVRRRLGIDGRTRAAAAVAVRRRRAGAPVPAVRCTRSRAHRGSSVRSPSTSCGCARPAAGERSACSRATERSTGCTRWQRRACDGSPCCDRERLPASGCSSASGRTCTRCSSRPRASGRGWTFPARRARSS